MGDILPVSADSSILQTLEVYIVAHYPEVFHKSLKAEKAWRLKCNHSACYKRKDT